MWNTINKLLDFIISGLDRCNQYALCKVWDKFSLKLSITCFFVRHLSPVIRKEAFRLKLGGETASVQKKEQDKKHLNSIYFNKNEWLKHLCQYI